MFLRPKQRPYKTNNFYSALERQARLDKEVYQIVCKSQPKADSRGASADRRRHRKSKTDKYLNDPRPENMPILGDLYDMLRKQDEKEAQFIWRTLAAHPRQEIGKTPSVCLYAVRS